MKKIVLLAMVLVASATAPAQDAVETTVSTDVVSQYLWRGQDLGNVSLQPTLGVAWKGLSLSAWGSVGLTEAADTKELDLTLSYTLGGLTVSVIDYWFNAGLDPDNRYFKYDAHGTNHVFEATLGYDFGFASLLWATNFAGNDGVNNSGKRAYSSYFEANVPFTLGGAEFTATAGATPMASTYYGTSGFAVTNVSLKASCQVRITDTFALPLFAQVVTNPCSQKAYLVFGVTLQP